MYIHPCVNLYFFDERVPNVLDEKPYAYAEGIIFSEWDNPYELIPKDTLEYILPGGNANSLTFVPVVFEDIKLYYYVEWWYESDK